MRFEAAFPGQHTQISANDEKPNSAHGCRAALGVSILDFFGTPTFGVQL